MRLSDRCPALTPPRLSMTCWLRVCVSVCTLLKNAADRVAPMATFISHIAGSWQSERMDSWYDSSSGLGWGAVSELPVNLEFAGGHF